MKASALSALAILLFVLTSLSLGDIFIRRLPPRKWADSERVSIAFLTGAGLLSFFVFALSLAGLASSGVFIGFSTAVTLAYGWFAGPRVRLIRRMNWRSLFLLAPLVVFLAMYALYALGPETSPDAMDYHLAFADLYKRNARFIAAQDSYQAGFPGASEMLFLFCDSIGDFRACALSHLLFLVATIPLFLSFGKLIRNQMLGLVAAGLFVMAPIVGIDASTAYNDVALAAYGLGAAYLLALWTRDRDTGTLVLAATLSGMAMATKYTGAVAIAGGVLLICLAPRQTALSRIRQVLLFASICSIPVLPWLVKNAIAYGNPLFPFANAWFPNPHLHLSWENDYTRDMRAFNGVHWRQIPLEVTVYGFLLSGFIGPIFLLSPLALLAFRMAYARHLFFWTILWLGVYTANIGTRFLIPVLPFLCLGLAGVATIRPAAGWVLLYLHGLLSWPANTTWYCNQYAYRMYPDAVMRAFRYDRPIDYLRERDTYRIAKILEAKTPSDSVILSLFLMDRAYTDRRVILAHQSAKAQVVEDVLLRGSQATKVAPVLDCRFREPVKTIEISGESKKDFDQWSISQLTAFGRDGLRKPISVTSTLNPWYLHYLVDGSSVTRWRSWGPARGVNFTVRGADVSMLRVTEALGYDWRISGTVGSGGLVVAACAGGGQTVAEDLEQAAIRAVKDLGITHVLLRSDDSYTAYFAPIVSRHSRLVASEGAWLLEELK